MLFFPCQNLHKSRTLVNTSSCVLLPFWLFQDITHNYVTFAYIRTMLLSVCQATWIPLNHGPTADRSQFEAWGGIVANMHDIHWHTNASEKAPHNGPIMFGKRNICTLVVSDQNIPFTARLPHAQLVEVIYNKIRDIRWGPDETCLCHFWFESVPRKPQLSHLFSVPRWHGGVQRGRWCARRFASADGCKENVTAHLGVTYGHQREWKCHMCHGLCVKGLNFKGWLQFQRSNEDACMRHRFRHRFR